MRNLLLGLLLLVTSTVTSALDIYDGWYWNPLESGYGLNVEVQDGVLFVAIFIYDESGNPVWYIASGAFDASDSDPIFEADVLLIEGGPCFTCAYTSPGATVIGPIRLEFRDPGMVTDDGLVRMTFQGRTVSMRRQYWRFSDPLELYYALWYANRGLPTSLIFSDLYFFDQFVPGSTPGAGGENVNNGALVVGIYDAGLDMYAMGEQKSTGFWFYIFTATKEQMVGLYWILDEPGDPLVGSGTPFIGFRFGSHLGDSDVSATKGSDFDRLELERLERKRYGTKKANGMPSQQAQHLYRSILTNINGTGGE